MDYYMRTVVNNCFCKNTVLINGVDIFDLTEGPYSFISLHHASHQYHYPMKQVWPSRNLENGYRQSQEESKDQTLTVQSLDKCSQLCLLPWSLLSLLLLLEHHFLSFVVVLSFSLSFFVLFWSLLSLCFLLLEHHFLSSAVVLSFSLSFFVFFCLINELIIY